MKQADQSGHTSIGFAAMGTGSMKYPAKLVAKNMYQKVMDYSNNDANCSVQHVQFVLYPKDRNTLQVNSSPSALYFKQFFLIKGRRDKYMFVFDKTKAHVELIFCGVRT